MKRLLSFFLVIALLFTTLSLSAFAEEENTGGIFGSAKNLFGNAITGVADAATSAYNTAADALSGKLDGLLDMASGAFSDAGEWAEVFVGEKSRAISATAGATYENLQSWLSETGDSSLDVLHIAFDSAASSMGIVGENAEELWNTIQYYAEINNITPTTMVKFALCIMTVMVLSHTVGKDNLVGETAQDYISDTLQSWLENFHITDQESAERALAEITKSVDEYVDENTWVCKSCGEENHGNFCSSCGEAQPKGRDSWTCEECGQKNSGRFCSECGTARPVEKDSWTCEECGETNTGNYCIKCGASCPELSDVWICEKCHEECLGQFCANCGAERTS